MLHEKAGEKTINAPHAGVNQEMAKPPMARSAGIAELKLYTARIQEHPNTITPGTVKKVIPSPRPSQPEKAQMAVGGAGQRHRDFRFENTLAGQHG
jgi:hypothetical protein